MNEEFGPSILETVIKDWLIFKRWEDIFHKRAIDHVCKEDDNA